MQTSFGNDITLTAGGGTVNINLLSPYKDYIIKGAATLSSSWTIQPNPLGPAPTDKTMICFYWRSVLALAGNTVTVFGLQLNQQQVAKGSFIICFYSGGAWRVWVLVDDAELPNGVAGTTTTTLTNAGATTTWNPDTTTRCQVLIGSATLLGSYVFNFGGTPKDEQPFLIYYKATMTLNGNNITIGGISLSAAQALAGNSILIATYNSTTASWDVVCMNNFSTETYKVMGSAGDTTPDFLSGKVAKSVVVNANKVELDGDSTTPGNDQFYGTNNAGTKGWYPMANATILGYAYTITHADILTLNSVPIQLVGNPGVNKAIEIISYCATFAGGTTPYATNINLMLICDTADKSQIYDTAILASTVAKTRKMNPNVVVADGETQIVPNKALYATVETGDPTGGAVGQTVTINIIYRIITV